MTEIDNVEIEDEKRQEQQKEVLNQPAETAGTVGDAMVDAAGGSADTVATATASSGDVSDAGDTAVASGGTEVSQGGAVATEGERDDFADAINALSQMQNPYTPQIDTLNSGYNTDVGNTYEQYEKDKTANVYRYLSAKKKLQKRNASAKKLLLLGNALRHVANLAAVSTGAANQEYTDPMTDFDKSYDDALNQLASAHQQRSKDMMSQRDAQLERLKSAYDMQLSGLKAGSAAWEKDRAYQKSLLDASVDKWNKDRNYNLAVNKAAAQAAQATARLEETKRHNAQQETIARKNAATAQQRIANSKTIQIHDYSNVGTSAVVDNFNNDRDVQAEIKRVYDAMVDVEPGIKVKAQDTWGLSDYATPKANPSVDDMLIAIQTAQTNEAQSIYQGWLTTSSHVKINGKAGSGYGENYYTTGTKSSNATFD